MKTSIINGSEVSRLSVAIQNLVLDGNSYHDVDTSTVNSIGKYILQHVYPILLSDIKGITPSASRIVLKGVFKL
jgi:hypothetical protein